MNKLANYSTEKIFTILLENKSKKNYWDYISELRKRKSEEIFQKSVSFTTSDSLKERILGVDILAQFGIPRLHKKEIINILFELLRYETDKAIISSILSGISHNNEKLTIDQVSFLCSFKIHKSVDVRFNLVMALCSIEQVKAIDTLIELTNDKDSDIRNWATFGIGSQLETDNDEIRMALWNRVADGNQETKLEAIVGLANRKDSQVKEIIKRELKKGDYGTLLFEAVEILNDKDFLPLLIENLESAETYNGISEEWVAGLKNCIRKISE